MSETLQNPTPKKRPRWAKGFLVALRETGIVRSACDAAHIDRSVAYDLRKADEAFAADWDRALDEAADLLEAEARRRAELGVRRVKFHNGKPIMVPVLGSNGLVVKDKDGNPEMVPYVEHEYSDTLLIFLLKGANPEKYRERADVRHSGTIDVSKLTDDELRTIIES
jgi:hypothetical protein